MENLDSFNFFQNKLQLKPPLQFFLLLTNPHPPNLPYLKIALNNSTIYELTRTGIIGSNTIKGFIDIHYLNTEYGIGENGCIDLLDKLNLLRTDEECSLIFFESNADYFFYTDDLIINTFVNARRDFKRTGIIPNTDFSNSSGEIRIFYNSFKYCNDINELNADYNLYSNIYNRDLDLE